MFNALAVIKSLEWDENKHKRAGKGTRQGGQFISTNATVDYLDSDPNRLFLLTDEQLAKNYKQAKESPLYNPAVEEFRSAIADLMPDEVEAEYDDLREQAKQLTAKAEEIAHLSEKTNSVREMLDNVNMTTGASIDMIRDTLKGILSGIPVTKSTFIEYVTNRLNREIKNSENWRASTEDEQKAAVAKAISYFEKLYDVTIDYVQALKDYSNHTTGLRQAHQAAIEKANKLIDEKIKSKPANNNTVDVNNVTGDVNFDAEKVCERGLDLASQLEVKPPKMSVFRGGGSSYNAPTKRLELDVTPNIDLSIIFAHEYGHHIESVIPAVHTAALDFISRRVGDEKPEEERRWYMYRDAFLIPYTGYFRRGNDLSEVVSVGMEMLVRDPVSLAKHDPEHFYLMAHVLWGM